MLENSVTQRKQGLELGLELVAEFQRAKGKSRAGGGGQEAAERAVICEPVQRRA